MAESIYAYARGILFFLLFMHLCMQLVGTSEYRQYIRFIFGLVLIVLCLKPIFDIAGKTDTLSYQLQKYLFWEEVNNPNAELFLAEESRTDAIFAAYEEELKKQAEKLLEEEGLQFLQADFVFSRDEENYAKIMEITVLAAYDTGRQYIQIEPIQIGKEKGREENDFLSPLEIHIKNKLAGFYNVKEDNINVIVQENSGKRE